MPTITPQALVDEVLTQATPLARALFEGTQDRLEGRHPIPASDKDRALFLSLADTLRRQREAFLAAFQERLTQELRSALQQSLNDAPPVHAPSLDFSELSLVDEQQALEDVAIAATIRAVEEAARMPLQILNQLFDALRPSAANKRTVNPLRPAVFARLLAQTFHELKLAPGNRPSLIRLSGEVLAEQLAPVFEGMSERIQAAHLLTRPSAPGEGSAHRAAQTSGPDAGTARSPKPAAASISAQALAASDDPPTTPHTLEQLLHRMQRREAGEATQFASSSDGETTLSFNTLLNSLQLPPDTQAPPSQVTPAPPGNLRFPPLFNAEAADPAQTGRTVQMLSRVYERILDDPELLPAVRSLLARLQMSVLRVALKDHQLLSKQEHPTWQFINAVAAHSRGFDQSGEARLAPFLALVNTLVGRISGEAAPNSPAFTEALQALQQYVEAQGRPTRVSTQSSIERLERAQQREQWRDMLRQQIKEQLAQAVVSTSLRDFLDGPWSQAIAEAMVRWGPQGPQVQPMIALVDDLLWSVQPLRHAEEREQLRHMLPTLTARLEFGFELIQWPVEQRQALMDELFQRHARLLRLAPDPRPSPPAAATPAATPELLSDSRWLDSRHQAIDRAHLPTVPLPFGPTGDEQGHVALDAWIAELRSGSWCHMFVQSEWVTRQLSWVSDSGQYFVFAGDAQTAPLSFTRGALLQLRSHGLLTELEVRNLVQRTVDSLMLDLD